MILKKEIIARVEALEKRLLNLCLEHAQIAQKHTDREAAFHMGKSIAYDAARAAVSQVLYVDYEFWDE